MTTRYLLSCSCGRKIPVEPRQAGQVVGCSCGASFQAPTMLEMAALERAEPEPAPPAPSPPWGVRQSLALLGAAIFLIALGLATYLVLARPMPPRRPPLPTVETVRRGTLAFSPVESLQAWRFLRTTGLRRPEPLDDPNYKEELFVWRLWMGVVLIIAIVGVGLIVTPLLIKRRPPARNPRAT